MLRVWIPRERAPGETRVAAVPETVARLVKEGFEVTVETGAGAASRLEDAAYEAAGARIAADAAEAPRQADVVLRVRAPSTGEAGSPDEISGLKAGAVLIGLLAPDRNLEAVRRLAEAGVSALALELLPRITRAQPMDALSSQASIAGYKAAILAASRLGKHFPMLMTAAGTIPPARVVVMGAGVAGLQAIATAKRLGAVVEVSDIRPAVKEQVESLGGRFIELPAGESGEGKGGYAREMSEEFLRRQREIVKRHLAQADVVITTALVPGRKAPVLVTADMVEGMRRGAVIIDLAVEQGGNCELSQPDAEVERHGVLILGVSNLAATLPHDASMLFSRNVLALLLHLVKSGQVTIDTADEVLSGTLLTHRGEILHAATAEKLQGVAS